MVKIPNIFHVAEGSGIGKVETDKNMTIIWLLPIFTVLLKILIFNWLCFSKSQKIQAKTFKTNPKFKCPSDCPLYLKYFYNILV